MRGGGIRGISSCVLSWYSCGLLFCCGCCLPSPSARVIAGARGVLFVCFAGFSLFLDPKPACARSRAHVLAPRTLHPFFFTYACTEPLSFRICCSAS